MAFAEVNRQRIRFETAEETGIMFLLEFHQDLLNERFQGGGFPEWAVQDGGLATPATASRITTTRIRRCNTRLISSGTTSSARAGSVCKIAPPLRGATWPRAFIYDRSTRTFGLRYTTARVSGTGSFPVGSVTAIATPPSIYEWRGLEHLEKAIAARTGQVLITEAPAPAAGWRRLRCVG